MYLTNDCHPGLSLNRDLQLCRASGPTAPSISSRSPPAPPHTLTRCPRLYRRSCHVRALRHFFEGRCDRLDCTSSFFAKPFQSESCLSSRSRAFSFALGLIQVCFARTLC